MKGEWQIAYLTPYGRNHKVTGVVTVVDQPVRNGPVSNHILISHGIASHRSVRKKNLRQRSLGHLDPRTVEVLLKTSVELCQSAVLEIGDTLLLVLDVSPRSQLKGRHIEWIGYMWW